MKKILLSVFVVLAAPSVFACVSLEDAKSAIVAELSKSQNLNATKYLGAEFFDAGVNNFLESLSLQADGTYTTSTDFQYNNAQAGQPEDYVFGVVVGEVSCDGTTEVVTALSTP